MKFILLAVVLMTHYGYYLAQPDHIEALFYVLRGIEGAVLFAIIATYMREMLAVAVCWLGVFEESQTAVCGMTGHGIEVPLASGLCLEQFGYWPYAVFAASALTFLWTRRDDWKSR